jgi:hypothetical protein
MWAIFCKGQQVSRPFPTEREIWHYARKSSLITNRRLTSGFEIRQLAAALLQKLNSETFSEARS